MKNIVIGFVGGFVLIIVVIGLLIASMIDWSSGEYPNREDRPASTRKTDTHEVVTAFCEKLSIDVDPDEWTVERCYVPRTTSAGATIEFRGRENRMSDDLFQDYLLCHSLRVEKTRYWGQTPETIYDGDPRSSGQLKIGDRVRFLMSPQEGGEVRVKVFPVDGRSVGGSNDQVWIRWDNTYGVEEHAFKCED